MINIKRILCPIDLSECSRHALDHAVAMARRCKGQVTALHVFTNWPLANPIRSLPSGEVEPGLLPEVDRDALLHQMKAFVERDSAVGVRIALVLQEAPDVHREILAQAEALNTDLIVLGSHGRSGFEHFLLGSITEKVLRKAKCPVMVVPRSTDTAAPSGVADAARILCAVDFSDGSIAALQFALSLADQSGSHLVALHVVEMPSGLFEASMSAGFNMAAWRTATQASCLERLRELIPDSARPYCTVDAVVSEGKASGVILRTAEERHSDLIVMGARGHGGIDALFGSNTHNVIRAASCPVLTVHGHSPTGGRSLTSKVEHAA